MATIKQLAEKMLVIKIAVVTLYDLGISYDDTDVKLWLETVCPDTLYDNNKNVRGYSLCVDSPEAGRILDGLEFCLDGGDYRVAPDWFNKILKAAKMKKAYAIDIIV